MTDTDTLLRSPAAPTRSRPVPAPPRRPAPRRPEPRPAPRRAQEPPRQVGSLRAHRMPFVVLLCGLLAGALASLLVISTTLAEGSFRITTLQQQVNQLARQRQQLQEAVAADQSPEVIAQRAYRLGMRPPGELRFIDLKHHRIKTAGGDPSMINVPGYTP